MRNVPIRLADKVGGHTLLEIRDFLRWIGKGHFYVGHVERRLQISKEKAEALLGLLVERGFVEPLKPGPWYFREDTPGWETTVRGDKLRNTVLRKRTPRAQADPLASWWRRRESNPRP